MRFAVTLLILTSGFSLNAFAVNPPLRESVCFNKLVEIKKWGLAEEQIKCLEGNKEFIEGLLQICNAEGSDFSDKYTAYQDYKRKYDEAFQKLRSAQSGGERTLASLAMNRIGEEWKSRGFKREIEDASHNISRGEYQCSPRSKRVRIEALINFA